MEWKESLFTLGEKNVLTQDDLGQLSHLPTIRDDVFFPAYQQFGYVPKQFDAKDNDGLITLDLGLISVAANREIRIEYCFNPKLGSALEGFFSETVFILNADKGWDTMMQISIRAKRKFNIILPGEQLFLRSYTGTFEERCRKCLNNIKNDYYNYALEIIAGNEWDNGAWTDPR